MQINRVFLSSPFHCLVLENLQALHTREASVFVCCRPDRILKLAKALFPYALYLRLPLCLPLKKVGGTKERKLAEESSIKSEFTNVNTCYREIKKCFRETGSTNTRSRECKTCYAITVCRPKVTQTTNELNCNEPFHKAVVKLKIISISS